MHFRSGAPSQVNAYKNSFSKCFVSGSGSTKGGAIYNLDENVTLFDN